VNHLLGGPFFPDDWISVISEQGSGLDRKEVKRPKIIIGVSITPTAERSFPTSAWVFPAIIDTGCNQALEIDERHLYLWNSTKKDQFDLIKRRHRPGKRTYEIRTANIWLHLEPYSGPRFKGPKMPFHLMGSDEIVVMDQTTGEPEPRFPLLGLKAFAENNLKLIIDGTLLYFDIYE
jgi:hypothetical protein